MRMRSLVSTPVVLGALALALPARAQEMADPIDPIEEKALREEAQAKFEASLATFRQAFDACVKQAQGAKPGEVVHERNLARAEVLLEKIDALSERITKQKDTEKFLAGYDAAALGPVLESQVRFERAKELLSEGDRDGAMRLLEPLDVIRHWWILGPFDNERGRAFTKDEFKAGEIHLDAKLPGKEREVAWREFQASQSLGYVDLDTLLRPNDQAAAYAVAFVKSDAEQDGALRLGSDEAVRAWWNGKEILSRNVRRAMGFDQDVAGIHVARGWNALLLKVHDQTGEWGFRARLTGADGSPLKGVTIASTRAEADEAAAAKVEASEPKTPVAGGAKQFYDGVTWKTVDGKRVIVGNAQDAFHLGYLHDRRGFDSFSDRTAENLLLHAAEADPTNAIYRFHYAEAAAPPTEMSVEKEENKQRAGREKAIEVDPKYAVAYRALAAYYTHSLVNLERAEQLLRRALDVNPDFWQARLDLANVLERRGLRPAAGAERDKALASAAAAGVEEAQRATASMTEKNGMGPAAADAWREVLKLDATNNDARRRVAELAAQALDRKSAIAVLDEMVAWNPYDLGALARKAEIQEGAGDFAAAQVTLRQALAVAPEDDGLLQALGRVQTKAGQDKEALATFRDALRVNPKLQTLERYVEFLDPDAAPYEDDFHIDVAALAAKAKDWPNKENDGWIVLLDQTVTRVNRDGTTSNYTHMAAKILNDAGVKNFDQYSANSWGGESFKWKLARVIKKNGDVVEAKTNRQSADFPPLEHGDIVDVEYRRDERQQSFFGDYYGETMFFADRVPVLQSTWSLLTPSEREFHFHERNMDVKPVETLRDEGKTRVYTWTRTDIAKIREEPAMPDWREIAPQVQVTTYKDWNAFAMWWSSMIKDQYTLNPDMQKKVRELTAGKESRMDKIRAIYEFVTGDITYQAWEFNVHGYKPYTATAIFDKKEGDCKDKALLFNTMLKEVGIEGYPVLLYADTNRGDEDMTLAQVGLFNHCIAYVPDTDGKGTPMFFDGTAEYASAFQPPMMDQGAKALVVRPDGASFITIPKSTPAETGMVYTWHVKVHEDGSATATLDRKSLGDFAVFTRQQFSVEGQRPLMLQRMLAPVLGKFKITKQQFSDLKDLSKPEASCELTLEIEKFATVSGDKVTLPTDLADIVARGLTMGIRQVVSRPTRERDMVILSTGLGFKVEVDYELPSNWSVVAPPSESSIALPTVGFTSKASFDANKLHLSREMHLTGDRVKAAEYPAFREAVSKGLELANQKWQVKKSDAGVVEGTAPQGTAPAQPANPVPPIDGGPK